MTDEQLAKGTEIHEECGCLKRDYDALIKGMPDTKRLRIAGINEDWEETFEIMISNEIINAVGDLLAGNFKREIENLLNQFAGL